MISCILLAISVSIDALTLGITYGIKHSRITKISNLIVFSIAFVSTSLAILLGKHILFIKVLIKIQKIMI